MTAQHGLTNPEDAKAIARHEILCTLEDVMLIEANRGGKPRMTVEKPLIVYREPGVYMEEIYEIYGY